MPTENLLVRDIMTTRFVAFRPEMDIDTATRTILSRKLMGGPVIDGAGMLVGVLAEKDVFRVLANRVFDLDNEVGGTVADFMTSEGLVTVRPSVGLASIASKFLSHAHRGLPVVEDGRVVGLISRRDVLAALEKIRGEPALNRYPDYRRPAV